VPPLHPRLQAGHTPPIEAGQTHVHYQVQLRVDRPATLELSHVGQTLFDTSTSYTTRPVRASSATIARVVCQLVHTWRGQELGAAVIGVTPFVPSHNRPGVARWVLRSAIESLGIKGIGLPVFLLHINPYHKPQTQSVRYNQSIMSYNDNNDSSYGGTYSP
jgi:hypothetical protein